MNARTSAAVVVFLALVACVVVMDPRFQGGSAKGGRLLMTVNQQPGTSVDDEKPLLSAVSSPTAGGATSDAKNDKKNVAESLPQTESSEKAGGGGGGGVGGGPTVAVIIAGGLRTFSVVQESLLQNVVQALQPDPSKRQVFFEISTTPDCHAASTNKRVANYVSRCEAQFKAYNDGYFDSAEFKRNWSNPVVWFSNSLNCKHEVLSPMQCCIKYPYSDQDHPTGFLGFMSYARRSIAIQKVMAYSREKKVNFSWVAVVRPDLYFFEPMPPASYLESLPPRLYLASKEMGQGPGDYLYVFPGSMLDTMQWALLDVFEKWCIESNPYMNTGPPEGRVHVQWTARKVAIQVFPFSFAITRSADSADCFRINNEVWRGHIHGYDGQEKAISTEQMCKQRFPNAFDPR